MAFMPQIRILTALPLALLALSGCTGGSSDGEGLAPQNAEEAIGKLSDEHRRAFESWKKQVVKACSPSQAFGIESGRPEENGIDGGALIEMNGGSVVFTEDNGFMVLGGYESFSGYGESKAESSSDINGSKYSVSAQTKRSGSKCEIFLYGQKVHETVIARRFTLGAQWMQGKVALAKTGQASIELIGNRDLGEATRHGVSDVIRMALGPSTFGVSMMAKKLGITNEQAAAFFLQGSAQTHEIALAVSGSTPVIWSQLQDGTLVARSEKLRAFFMDFAGNLSLEARLPIPQVKFGLVENTSDRGNLKLEFRLSSSPGDGTIQYNLESMQPRGLVPFDRTEGLECAADRANAFVGRRSTGNTVQPTYSKVFGACKTLYAEVEDAAIESNLATTLIPKLFAGVELSHQTNYGGWDTILSKLAIRSLERGDDLRIELDPRGETLIVPRIADHLMGMRDSMSGKSRLVAVKDRIYQMGLSWSYMGESVPALKIREILNATDNAIDPFEVSTLLMLQDLGRFPYGYEDRIQFARSLDSEFKAEGTKAITLARSLDYKEFETQVFNLVLQLRTTRSELSEWSSRMSIVKNEIDRFGNLNEVKGRLTSLGIKWLREGTAQSTEIAGIFGAIDNVAADFPESTGNLLQSLSNSLDANRDTLDFARSISPEYKQLVQGIVLLSMELGHEASGRSFSARILQDKPSLEQVRARHETLSSSSAFTKREQTRTQGDTSNEWRRKNVVETAIKEGWSRSDFETLEAFAEIAKFKNGCEHHAGASSLSTCASSRLFSRERGNLFDPNYGGRYAGIARDFLGYMNSLAGNEHWSLRSEFTGKLFGFNPIWSRCDVSTFWQKSQTLKQQMNAFVNERDGSEQWRLERAIRETLQDCR